MMEAGKCIRTEGGIIVPKAVHETPAAAGAMLANLGYVREFVRDLLATTEQPTGIVAGSP